MPESLKQDEVIRRGVKQGKLYAELAKLPIYEGWSPAEIAVDFTKFRKSAPPERQARMYGLISEHTEVFRGWDPEEIRTDLETKIFFPPEKAAPVTAQAPTNGKSSPRGEAGRKVLAPEDEKGFQEWYKGEAAKRGLNPNPDDPLQKYDYRKFYASGMAEDDHFPSEFKDDDHPNRMIRENGKWLDTKSGRNISEEQARAWARQTGNALPGNTPPPLDSTGGVQVPASAPAESLTSNVDLRVDVQKFRNERIGTLSKLVNSYLVDPRFGVGMMSPEEYNTYNKALAELKALQPEQQGPPPREKAIREGRPIRPYGRYSSKTELNEEDRAQAVAELAMVQKGGFSPREAQYMTRGLHTPFMKEVRSFATGGAGVVEGILGAAEGMGIPGGKEAADKVQGWVEALAVENPTFGNKVFQGFGSMAIFIPFGIGVGSAASMMARLSPNMARLFGMTGASFLEAATEAGGVYRSLTLEGKSPEAARVAATEAFLKNMALVTITNKFGVFSEAGKSQLLKAIKSAPIEGLQEWGQELIAANAEGRKPSDELEQFLIGMLVGAGAGSVFEGTEGTRGKEPPPPTEGDFIPRPIDPGQTTIPRVPGQADIGEFIPGEGRPPEPDEGDFIPSGKKITDEELSARQRAAEQKEIDARGRQRLQERKEQYRREREKREAPEGKIRPARNVPQEPTNLQQIREELLTLGMKPEEIVRLREPELRAKWREGVGIAPKGEPQPTQVKPPAPEPTEIPRSARPAIVAKLQPLYPKVDFDIVPDKAIIDLAKKHGLYETAPADEAPGSVGRGQATIETEKKLKEQAAQRQAGRGETEEVRIARIKREAQEGQAKWEEEAPAQAVSREEMDPEYAKALDEAETMLERVKGDPRFKREGLDDVHREQHQQAIKRLEIIIALRKKARTWEEFDAVMEEWIQGDASRHATIVYGDKVVERIIERSELGRAEREAQKPLQSESVGKGVLAIKLRSGETLSDPKATLHSQLLKGISETQIVDIGYLDAGGKFISQVNKPAPKPVEPEESPRGEEAAEVLSLKKESPNDHAIVVKGKNIGFIQHRTLKDGTLDIVTLKVDEGSQRKGYGREALLQLLQEKGPDFVSSTELTENGRALIESTFGKDVADALHKGERVAVTGDGLKVVPQPPQGMGEEADQTAEDIFTEFNESEDYVSVGDLADNLEALDDPRFADAIEKFRDDQRDYIKNGMRWDSGEDAFISAIEKILAKGKSEKLEEPKPRYTPKNGEKLLGQNELGEDIYEDAKGVRFRIEGNIRASEPVAIIPTRAGVQTTPSRNRPDEFKLASEIREEQREKEEGEDAPTGEGWASKPLKDWTRNEILEMDEPALMSFAKAHGIKLRFGRSWKEAVRAVFRAQTEAEGGAPIEVIDSPSVAARRFRVGDRVAAEYSGRRITGLVKGVDVDKGDLRVVDAKEAIVLVVRADKAIKFDEVEDVEEQEESPSGKPKPVVDEWYTSVGTRPNVDYVRVPGEAVKLKAAPNDEFFFHPSLDNKNIVLTHALTGIRLKVAPIPPAGVSPSQMQAIKLDMVDDANKLLTEKREAYEKSVQEVLDAIGSTPRYGLRPSTKEKYNGIPIAKPVTELTEEEWQKVITPDGTEMGRRNIELGRYASDPRFDRLIRQGEIGYQRNWKPEDQPVTTDWEAIRQYLKTGELSEHGKEVDAAASRLRELSGGDILERASYKVASAIIVAARKGRYNDYLHPDNNWSRALYAELTGAKLPKGVKATKDFVDGHPREIKLPEAPKSPLVTGGRGAKIPTQKEKVKDTIAEGPKHIKDIAAETGIVEPNVRRILGMGAKDGTFERTGPGVYVLKRGNESIAVVHNADAKQTLNQMAYDGFKADMVFLDIPYFTAAIKGGNRGINYATITPADFEGIVQSINQIVGADTPVIHMFSQAPSGMKQMKQYNDVILDHFKPVARGFYAKTYKDGKPALNVRGEPAAAEAIILLTRSGNLPNLTVADADLQFTFVRPKRASEKPQEMMERLIEMTTPVGGMVLDPFAGSGVTGAAAIKKGRKATLIELDPDIVKDLILPRIEQAAKPALSEKQQKAKDEFDALAEEMKKLLGGQEGLTSGFDPRIAAVATQMAAKAIEMGLYKFEAFAKAMIKQFGDIIRPYLKRAYAGARVEIDSAAILSKMDDENALRAIDVDAITIERDEDAGMGGTGQEPLEDVPPEPLREPGEQGDTSDEGGRGGRTDGEGDGGVDGGRGESPGGVGEGEGEVPVSPGGRGGREGEDADLGSPRGDNLDDPTGGPRGINYQITDKDRLGIGTITEKYDDNIAAIKLVRELEERPTMATQDEQAILARYVGWGGMKAAFPRDDGSYAKGWERRGQELKALLSPEEYRAAARSTPNAHYTSEPIVRAIYTVLDRFGFRGGRILEPSMGTGNFFGLMPRATMNQSELTGIELDDITSLIAKHLYPRASVLASTGFQDAVLADEYFDVSVGNPPFGSYSVPHGLSKHLRGYSIHNYFFARTVDKLRPGGLLTQVVSKSFLDKRGEKERGYIAERTRFIGAIRLPNTAFMENANTEVTTDIVFLQKLPKSEWGTADDTWLSVGEIPDPLGGEPIPLNQYFIDHPEMMLGRMERSGTMRFGNEPTLAPNEGEDLDQALADAIGRLPEGIYEHVDHEHLEELEDAAVEGIPEDAAKYPSGSFMLSSDGTKILQRIATGDGAIKVREITDQTQWSEKQQWGQSRVVRLRHLLEIRDVAREQIRAEYGDVPKKEMEVNRKKLNKVYDRFVENHGYITERGNRAIIADDYDLPLLLSLENDFESGVTKQRAKTLGVPPREPSAKKADIFRQRVVGGEAVVREVKTPKDALFISLADKGAIDMPFIAKQVNMTEQEVIDDLTNADPPIIFRDPATNEWLPADEYLSGNVKRKAEIAKANGLNDHVKALQAVFPKDLTPDRIRVQFSAPWVPSNDYEAFARHLFGEETTVDITAIPNGRFVVNLHAGSDTRNREWGTEDASGAWIFERLINNKDIIIKDGGKPPKVDPEATTLAKERGDAIRDAWDDWLFSDEERRERLVKFYNDNINVNAEPTYNGAHLTLPGKVPDAIIKFRVHQMNAVWRMIRSKGNTLLDHVVGSGKTFTIVATAMEMRRIGLARKPLVVVPNHLVEQWATDWLRLYPGAKLLTMRKKDFQKAERKEMLSRIATGDWDGVIIAHSSFGFIPVSPATHAKFVQQQIDDMQEVIAAVREAEGDKSRTVREIQESIIKAEIKLQGLLDRPRDETLTFEELGVDQMFLDESQEFKNLFFATMRRGARGLGNPKGSQKATDMYMKTQWVQDKRNNRGVVFATGTPVSNSLSEVYTLQRYLGREELTRQHIKGFDPWLNSYGATTSDYELDGTGVKYKSVERLRMLQNLPSLMAAFRQFADSVTNQQLLDDYMQQTGKEFPLPKVETGKRTNVVVPISEQQKDFFTTIVYRAENLPPGKPQKGDDNMLAVTMDARKAALDMRLIDVQYPAFNGRKAVACADMVIAKYKKYNKQHGTQLIFCDLSVPLKNARREMKDLQDLIKKAEDGDEEAQAALSQKAPDEIAAARAALGGFSVYDDMKSLLVERGIPEREIAFIHDYNTDDRKADLFEQMNAGRLRILMGSTPKMGAGTNVQKRLVHEYHLDCPWRPSDVEQREGRIIRQGNMLYEEDPENFRVGITAFATEKTYDARMWQVQEQKLVAIESLRSYTDEVEIEEVSAAAATAAEMKAAASGNPLILEEVQLKEQLRRLRLTARRHRSAQQGLVDQKKRAVNAINVLPARIPKLKADMADAEAYNKDPFAGNPPKGKVNGVEFTSYESAHRAAWDSVRDQKAAQGVTEETETAYDKAVSEARGDVEHRNFKKYLAISKLTYTSDGQTKPVTHTNAQQVLSMTEYGQLRVDYTAWKKEKGPDVEVYQAPLKPKATYEVEINGKKIKSVDGIVDALTHWGELKPFAMTIGDERVIVRRKAAEAIVPMVSRVIAEKGEPVPIAAIGGMTVSLQAEQSKIWSGSGKGLNVTVQVEGKSGETYERNSWHDSDKDDIATMSRGVIEDVENVVKYGIQNEHIEATSTLLRAQKELPEIEKSSGKEFPKAQELQEKEARYAQVAAELGVNTQQPEGGHSNKTITEEMYREAQRRLARSLGRLGMNPFLDPENVRDLVIVGAYHIEKGARTLSAFSKKMALELGDNYLKIKNRIKDIFDESMAYWKSGAPIEHRGLRESDWGIDRARMLAPYNPDWAYSRVRHAILWKMPAKTRASELKGILAVEVGEEEMFWSGMEDFIREKGNQVVTQQEVLDFLRDNDLKVAEVVKGGQDDDYAPTEHSANLTRLATINEALSAVGIETAESIHGVDAFYRSTAERVSRRNLVNRYGLEDANRYFDMIEEYRGIVQRVQESEDEESARRGGGTQYEDYTLKGGEEGSYRELLITLPERSLRQGVVPAATGETDPLRAEAARAMSRTLARGFRGPHFQEKNILLHVRFNERVDPRGRKVLFIEELQSDWHQKGREHGYNEPILKWTGESTVVDIEGFKYYPVQEMESGNWSIEVETRDGDIVTLDIGGPSVFESKEDAVAWMRDPDGLARNLAPIGVSSVPNAPFKGTSWQEVGLKRMIRWAAENNFEVIAWTTGEQQIDRYESTLRQNVDAVMWEKEARPTESGVAKVWVHVMADKDGRQVFSDFVPAEGTTVIRGESVTLDDLIGREMAKTIRDSKEMSGELESDDLAIGGTGMQTAYNEILPNIANRIGKRFGAKVAAGDVGTKPIYKYISSEEAESLFKKGKPVFIENYETQELERVADVEEIDDDGEYYTTPPGAPAEMKAVHVFPLPTELRVKALRGELPTFGTALLSPSPAFMTKMADEALSPWTQRIGRALTSAVHKLPADIQKFLRARFTQTPGIRAAWEGFRGDIAEGRVSVNKLTRMILNRDATEDEYRALDRLLRGHPEDFNNLPEKFRDAWTPAGEAYHELAQRLTAEMAALGLPIREEWMTGPSHWYKNAWKQHEVRMVLGRLFRGKPSAKMSAAEAGHTMARRTDRYTVYRSDGSVAVNPKTKEMAIFEDEADANDFVDRFGGYRLTYIDRATKQFVEETYASYAEREMVVRQLYEDDSARSPITKHPANRLTIAPPMTLEQMVGHGLIEDPILNVRKGVREATGLVVKTRFWTKLGEMAAVDEEGPGLVQLKDYGFKIPKSVANANEHTKRLAEGWIPKSLAEDLVALYGQRGFFNQMYSMVNSYLKAGLTVYNPVRYLKQPLENELSLFFADSGLWLNKAAQAQTFKEYLDAVMLNKDVPMYNMFIKLGGDKEDFFTAELRRFGKDISGFRDIEGSAAPLSIAERMDLYLEQNKLYNYLANKADRAKAIYHHEDMIYRYYAFRGWIQKGMSPKQAMERVENSFFYAKESPRIISELSRHVPFIIRVTYEFSRILATRMRDYPASTILKIGLMALGWDYLKDLMMEKAGWTEEDMKKMGEAAPDWWQMVTPMTDDQGRNVVIDLRWIIPFSELGMFAFGESDDVTKNTLRVTPLAFKGIVSTAFGKTAWGADIAKPGDPDWEEKYAVNLISQYMPYMMGTYWLNQYKNATEKDPDKQVPWYDKAAPLGIRRVTKQQLTVYGQLPILKELDWLARERRIIESDYDLASDSAAISEYNKKARAAVTDAARRYGIPLTADLLRRYTIQPRKAREKARKNERERSRGRSPLENRFRRRR